MPRISSGIATFSSAVIPAAGDKLVHEAERAIAQLAALGLVHALHILPQNLHLSTAGVIQSAEQVQQRALAGAGCADDGEAFPCRTSR